VMKGGSYSIRISVLSLYLKFNRRMIDIHFHFRPFCLFNPSGALKFPRNCVNKGNEKCRVQILFGHLSP